MVQHKQRPLWFPTPHLVIATQHQVMDATISSDGQRVVLGYLDAYHNRTVELRRSDNGKVRQTFWTQGPIKSLAISQNGTLLVTGSGWGPCSTFPYGSPGEVRVWNLTSPLNNTVSEQNLASPQPDELKPKKNGAKTSTDEPLYRLSRSREGWRYSVGCIALSPDGGVIAAGELYHQEKLHGANPGDDWYRYEGGVSLWDSRNGQLLLSLHGLGDEVNNVGFSPDGKTIVTGTSSQAKIWNAVSGNLLWALPLQQIQSDELCGVAWSPNGRQLVTATIEGKDGSSPSGVISLWDVATKRLLWTIKHGHRSGTVSFSPDNQLVVGSCGWGQDGDEEVESVILDASNGRTLRVLPSLERIVFSANNKTLMAFNTHEVQIFETSDVLSGIVRR